MALQKQLYQIPFSAGLDAKTDVRAKLPPALDIARDVEFDTVKGLVTRKPMAPISMSIIGGGTITSGLRRLVENGDELLLFTDTALYSWVTGKSAWALRDTYMAVAVDEVDVFGINGDQVSCDRAALNGTVLFTWIAGGRLYLAALDSNSGTVIMKPTLVDVTTAMVSVRLIALNTKILLMWRDSGIAQLRAITVDPANVAASIVTGTSISGTIPLIVWDAMQIPGTDTALVANGRSAVQYELYKVTAALVTTTVVKARGANGAIALAIDPTGTYVQVIRNKLTALTAVTGDLLLLSTLADVFTDQAIGTVAGTSVNHITCAYRPTAAGGLYQCYAFWTEPEASSGASFVAFKSRKNTVNTAGTIGTQADFITDLGIAARAFVYGSYVYLIGVFAGITPQNGGTYFPAAALQNTYFLYRDDGLLVAKCAADRAAGFVTTNALPGVAVSSAVVTWAGTVRRNIPAGLGNLYAGRAPCDITFTFDDDRARRCVRLGRTLYITGGQVMQYDGVSLTELGFHVFPYALFSGSGGTGNKAAGSYAVKATYRAMNAVGELDRSTTATVALDSGVAINTKLTTVVKPLYYSCRSLTGITVEGWTTTNAPVSDSAFYLSTSLDPTFIIGNNAYVANDPTATSVTILDAEADAVISLNAQHPENGSILESIAPPPATIIAADESRIFLAGVANQPDTVWYSKTRSDGFVASFNDALTFLVPSDGGDITGIAFLENGLVVFRETSIYAFSGDGYDNASGGNNYQLSKIVAVDCGAVSADAIATHDSGILFKSAKGWYMLDRGFNLQYVGGAVSSFDDDTIVATTVLTSQHQIRALSDSRALVFDYLVGQWSEWTLPEGIDACLYRGVYTIIDNSSTAVSMQRSDWSGVNYGMDVETAWIKLADLQGFARVYKYQILGEYESDHHLRVRFAYNYQYASVGVPLYVDDTYWTPYPTTAGSSLQVQVSPSIQQVESVKVRITASNPAEDGSAPSAGASLALTGIGLEVGIKQGLYKLLAAAQRR